MKKYELLVRPTHLGLSMPDAKVGATVYGATKHDFGLARDDTMAFGIEHKSVTLDADGGYPFFTCPAAALREIK